MKLDYLSYPPDPPEKALRRLLDGLGVSFRYTRDPNVWTVLLWLPSVLGFATRRAELQAVLESAVPALLWPSEAPPLCTVSQGYFEVHAGEVDPVERALQWVPGDTAQRPRSVLWVPLSHREYGPATVWPTVPNGFCAIYLRSECV